MEFDSNFSIIMTSLCKSHIAVILIYALWTTDNSVISHHCATAYRLKTTALDNNYGAITLHQIWAKLKVFKM